MKITALIILLSMHPVHVSLTGIDYNSDDHSYNIFIKAYIDDLQSDMKIYFGNKKILNDVDNDTFSEYLNDRVLILEDGKQIEMKVVTSETDGAEQRITLAARGKKKVSDLTVINRIMINLHSDQMNMMLFKFNDIEDACKFTATDTLRNYCLK